MSGDLFTYAINNGLEKTKYRKWMNLKIKKNMICLYPGKCLIDNNINNELCLYCKYRKDIDIPKMLNEMNGGRKNGKI